MKNLILVLAFVFALTGCGKKEKTPEGTPAQSKRNYSTAAMKYLKEGDVKRAVQSFDLAIRQEPKNVENYMLLGEVYLRLNNLVSAEDTFSAATRVDPNNGEAYYFLATSRAMQKKKELAIEAVKKSVEIFMQKQDKEKFRRAVLLLQSLTQAPKAVVAGAPETNTSAINPIEN